MSASALPGVVWVVLILALIPGVQSVLERFFPSSEYWYSALVVAVLGAIAKAVEVWARQQGMTIELSDEGPTPAADAQPMAITVEHPGRLQRWLLG
jgi:hypothetical protein